MLICLNIQLNILSFFCAKPTISFELFCNFLLITTKNLINVLKYCQFGVVCVLRKRIHIYFHQLQATASKKHANLNENFK